jgi:hypothetical protein
VTNPSDFSTCEEYLLTGPRGLTFAYQRHPAAATPSKQAVILLCGFGIHPRAFRLRSHCDWVGHWLATGVDVLTINLLPSRGDCTIDEQAAALVSWVPLLRERWGYQALHGLGFSLGGLQWLVALQATHSTEHALLDALVLIEAPVDLRGYPVGKMARFALHAMHRLGFSRVPYRWLNPFLAAAAPWLQRTAGWQKWANFSNLRQIPLSEIITATFDHVPVGVVRQLLCWIDTGELRCGVAQTDALANLGALDIPLLLVCGCNAYSARALKLQQTINPPTLICSRAAGFSADYGHSDLLLGDQLCHEVLPRIQDWLLTCKRTS